MPLCLKEQFLLCLRNWIGILRIVWKESEKPTLYTHTKHYSLYSHSLLPDPQITFYELKFCTFGI